MLPSASTTTSGGLISAVDGIAGQCPNLFMM
jgi:hypothetical protein